MPSDVVGEANCNVAEDTQVTAGWNLTVADSTTPYMPRLPQKEPRRDPSFESARLLQVLLHQLKLAIQEPGQPPGHILW